MKNIEVTQLTTNVYRTKDYIVIQNIYVLINVEENNSVMSIDTYYRRTIVRDCKYLLEFGSRKNVNGKRLPSNSYVRTYMD